MSVQSKEAVKPITVPEDKGAQVYSAQRRRRSILVNVLRVLIFVVIIGGWEIGARVKLPGTSAPIIDPFFWGQPSGIWSQLVTWATQGTAQGPLWEQIATTLEETVLGFLIGVVLGVFFGVLLGRVQFLADVLGPYIKAANSLPRVTLAPLLAIGLGLDIQSKVALAAILVFFIVCFNAFQGLR